MSLNCARVGVSLDCRGRFGNAPGLAVERFELPVERGLAFLALDLHPELLLVSLHAGVLVVLLGGELALLRVGFVRQRPHVLDDCAPLAAELVQILH
jgi:hypothetical protein